MALSIRNGALMSGHCLLSRLLLCSVRRSLCSCSWPPCVYSSDSRRHGVSNFERFDASNGMVQAHIHELTQPELGRPFLTQDEIKKVLKALAPSKRTRLYEMRNSTLEKVCAGQISLPCYNFMMTRQHFCNTSAAEFEKRLNEDSYEFKSMRLPEDYEQDISSLSVREAIEEIERLKADYLKWKEEPKCVSGPQASSISDPNMTTHDERKERPSETKTDNTKVKFDVDQTKMASKRPPENPPKQASLLKKLQEKEASKKLQEQGRQEQLRANLHLVYDKIMVVNNIETARQVVQKLTTEYRDFVHACDTEVSKINLKKETPVGHGEIISFSIYSFDGERKADFGGGKCCIWVDVLDGEGCTSSGEKNLLMEFASFFEDKSIKKVWHNYSFDSHIIQNYGIKLTGFHADTMHMARLWNSNKRVDGGYSLEALTSNEEVMDGKPDRATVSCSSKTTGPQTRGNHITSGTTEDDKLNIAKASIKSIFSKYKLRKDGKEGRKITVDAVESLQREDRDLWICYSALDSISTGRLFESLKKKLEARDWVSNGEKYGNMFEFYQKLWCPFGELLVQMEREGMYVNRSHLKEIENVATTEQTIAGERFRRWASKHCADAQYMNVGSDAQVRQLLFGGTLNSQDHNECLPEERSFKVLNTESEIEDGKMKLTKFRTITLKKIGEGTLSTGMCTASGRPSVSADALKILAGKIPSEMIYCEANGDSEDILEKVKYGTAYDAFGGGEEGKEACIAIAALCEICSIDSLLSNFIRPLQENQISSGKGRIHCSLNINTETGRLSARTPNLQNQPALEKDRYKIRQAFVAEPGNSLIVADYGQLELRILAHLSGCKTMLEAFKEGGDFHSRTAINMYDYIREAVKENKVLLEWKSQPGEDKPPVPLLKDVYAAERRKAKMLNFSIAYGKTAMGLAQDWKVRGSKGHT
ncbi:DNA polymerase I A, chloroplastic-like isoform X2 [Carex rostrata]